MTFQESHQAWLLELPDIIAAMGRFCLTTQRATESMRPAVKMFLEGFETPQVFFRIRRGRGPRRPIAQRIRPRNYRARTRRG